MTLIMTSQPIKGNSIHYLSCSAKQADISQQLCELLTVNRRLL